MATVINTPSTRESSDNGAAGWAVALAVLLAVGLLALFVWPGVVRNNAAPAAPGNINVTIPGADTGAGAGTGGTGGAPAADTAQ